MSSDMQDTLDWWRENPLRLREGDIPYESAIRSLGTSDAPVELRKQNSSRWTLYVRDSEQAAVFTYAAIFSMADDYYSGNLIPTGQPLPEDLPSERIERFATWKCQYAYAFDTAYDKSLFHLQQTLEEYASNLPGFNSSGLPRREYQSGNDLAYTWRYWMRAPMFLRVNEGEVRPPPPPHLHPWVIAAEKRSRIYRANPARPRVFSFDGDVVSSIENSDPDVLQRGDIVLVHFVVSIVFTPSAWYTELVPVELVRVVPVMRLTSDTLESGPPTVDIGTRPALMDGERIGGSAPAQVDAGDVRARKEPVPARVAARALDREPRNTAVAVTGPRSSRSSSSSSSVSFIASSVAAMEVDDPDDGDGHATEPEEPLGEPFEDLGAHLDRKAEGTGRPLTVASTNVPEISRGRSTRDSGSSSGQSRASSTVSRASTSGKRKRSGLVPSENSPTGSIVASDDDELMEGSGRRGRRNVPRVRR